MNLSDIELIEHPLRKQIVERGIPLWKLRLALGGSPSENKLHRVLRGIDSMSPELERRIRDVLEEDGEQKH